MSLRKELELLCRWCLHHWNLVYRLKNLLQPLRHHILRIPPIVINRLLIALLFHMWSLRLLLNWTFFIMDLYLVCTTIKLYTRLEKRTGLNEENLVFVCTLQGTTNVCDKSSGETVEASYERTHPVFRFFKFNSVHGKSECIVDGCGVLRNGKNPANLINHLRVKHPKKAYTEFMAKWTTNWARPKRTTRMVNLTDITQPSKILQSTRAKVRKFYLLACCFAWINPCDHLTVC